MKYKIQSQNKQATLTARQLILFQHCRIIHAQGRSGQDYYTIFHKERYINTVKIQQLKEHSFLATAIEHGLIIEAPHYAIEQLIDEEIFPTVPLNKMLSSIVDKSKSLESLIILSYFDHFITKDQIIEQFSESFREHRRGGKLKQSYLILQTLKSYDPENHFAKDMLATLTLQGYEVDDQAYFSFMPLQLDHLESIYLETDAHFELSILSTYQLLNKYSDHHFELFHKTLIDHQPSIQRKTLTQMIKQNEKLIEHDTFLNAFLNVANPNQYVNFVLKTNFSHPIDEEIFVEQLSKMKSAQQLNIFINNGKVFLTRIKDFTKREQEKAIRMIVESVIPHISLDEIIDWLSAFEGNISFYKQLLLMKELSNHPDKQGELATLYQQFNHLEGAIDCLRWEIELDPINEETYKKIIHLLKATGQQEEADDFQEQWIHQTKYSN